MTEVRLTSGLKAGDVVDVPDDVAGAFLASGKAERVEPPVSEVAEILESPEKPARRRRSATTATIAPETR